MEELQELYGPVGIGLIIIVLPLLLQLIKQVSGWQDTTMKVVSVVATYVLVDLFLLSTVIDDALVNTTPGTIVLYILGGILYPVFVWLATQGVYANFIRPSNSVQVSGK